MAGNIKDPMKDYSGTHIIDEPKNIAWEVADFLFGVKSMQKIASGNGSWGDALNIGITAATFFIPPAKLVGLGSKVLGKIALNAEKVAAHEATSEIGKRVALRTGAEARSIMETGLPLAERETTPISKARFDKITGPEPEVKPTSGPSYQVTERTSPTEAAIKEKSGEAAKKYSRISNEEYDHFNPSPDVKQEAEDFINSQGPTKKLLTKEELNLKDVNKSQLYDKRELTDKELYQGIEMLLEWNKNKASKDVEEVARSYSAIKKALQFEKTNPGTLNPKDKAYLDIIFPELEKEFRTKVAKTKNGERILSKVDEELPENLPPEIGMLEELDPDTGRVVRTFEEAEDTSNIPPIPRGPMTTSIGAKIPEDLKTTPKIDRVAYLQAEIRKLENFNKSNNIEKRTANASRFDELTKKSLKNKDLIDKYNNQLKDLSKKLSEGERATSFKVAEEITRRGIAESKNKSVLGEPNIKSVIPGKGVSTAKLTTQGKIAKARVEVERLREEWKNVPASDTKTRSRLAKEAKKFADYIEKLEGK